MSFVNQPSRILISGDDLEWSSNTQYGGQSLNLTLPESVVGAKGVDCARAVIPTTLYNIPDYQNRFYYNIADTTYFITLTNDRVFNNIGELIIQLNSDAVAQGAPVIFSYDLVTTRITATFSVVNFPHVIVDDTNNIIGTAGVVEFLDINLINGTYIPADFATMVAAQFQIKLQLCPGYETSTVSGYLTTIPDPFYAINSLSLQFENIFGFNGWVNVSYTPAQSLLTGYVAVSAIFIQPNNPFTFRPGPVNILSPETASVSNKSQWTTKYALNTRLGFPNTGISATVSGSSAVARGTFLPNILRTRVIYLLSNASVNDSITTDGLRNVIAKIPVTSGYGGFSIYEQKDYNFCRIIQSSYQNVTLSLLDENYEPYELVFEEPMEIELVFSYENVRNE